MASCPTARCDFQHETHNQPVFQPAPVVNYPNEHPYTRITEFKYLTGQDHPKSSIVYEFPQAEGDPYYPIPRPENAELYRKYKALADETPGVHFVGRLATYKYYNMDQVTAQALTLYKQIIDSSDAGRPAKGGPMGHGWVKEWPDGNGKAAPAVGASVEGNGSLL